jgi:quinoprotein glucose dehydrogenase
VPPAAQLELLDAAAQRQDPAVKQLLAAREDRLAASNDPLAPYRVALEGGNARAGARIFLAQPVMACIRCHSAGNGGGDAGPNLAMIGQREGREYLLESVVKPNAKIAPGFDSVVVTLKSGGVVGGIVAGETADTIKLRNADGKVVDVKKSEIAKREGAPSSMPEIYGAILTKKELRDVVAFLASLTHAPEDVATSEQPRALHHWND